MLDNIRKHSDKIMWIIALIFIGGIFFWYGSGSGLETSVIKTDEFTIEVSAYRERLNRTLRNKREEKGAELSEEEIARTKQEVLSSMLNTETLYHQAKKMGLIVTDREVASTIRSLPQFQQDGKFHTRLYRQVLQYHMNMTPAEFEDLIRKDIYTQKVERIILSTAEVTEPELRLAYLTEHNSLDKFEENKEELRNSVIREKRVALYRQWMTYLRRDMELEVNPELAGLQ